MTHKSNAPIPVSLAASVDVCQASGKLGAAANVVLLITQQL